MNTETKAILTILIHEIQKCRDMAEVNELLVSWIKASDLRPETVRIRKKEDFIRSVSNGI